MAYEVTITSKFISGKIAIEIYDDLDLAKENALEIQPEIARKALESNGYTINQHGAVVHPVGSETRISIYDTLAEACDEIGIDIFEGVEILERDGELPECCTTLEEIVKFAELREERDDIGDEDLIAICNDTSGIDEAREQLERLIGIYKDFTEYAEEIIDNTISEKDKSSVLYRYFDWKYYAKDLQIEAEYTEVPSGYAIFS